MNRDQVKGRGKEAAGKVQKEAGKLTGSTAQRAKGLAREAAGKVQKNLGDARQDLERSQKRSARSDDRS